jgi:hypothetical protein
MAAPMFLLRPPEEIVMRLLLSFLLTLLFLTACATQTAQTPPAGLPAEIGASPLQPGSVWRYAVHDGYTGQARGTVEYRVRAVSAAVATVEVLDRNGQRIELYAPDGNWIERPATNMQTFRYRPEYRAFDFPLFAGKRWDAQATAVDPANGRSFPVRIEGHVAGWTRVHVPAGEYDALEVRRTVYLNYFELGVRGQSIINETDWYAPSLHQVVRRETISKFLRLAEMDRSADFVPVRGGGGRGGGGRGGRGGRDRSDGGGVPYWERDEWLVYELLGNKI